MLKWTYGNMIRLPLRKKMNTFKCALANTMTRQHKYPFYASFKLTRRCMLKCPFCDVWKGGEGGELDTYEVLRVLDNLASSSIVVISFEGGEPFLRDDIEEILSYAKKKPIYTELTTSGVCVDWECVRRCTQHLDYLHISIDEGHRNLHLLDELQDLVRIRCSLAIQIVVRQKDIGALEAKIEKIWKAGIKTVVMPAVHIQGTHCAYPDPTSFKREIIRLKKLFPGTIITSNGYLNAISRKRGCDTASIIIDADGSLYYPCHILKTKAINTVTQSLEEFLSTHKAKTLRLKGRRCSRRCGWYQYFATSSYYSPISSYSSLRPYLKDIVKLAG